MAELKESHVNEHMRYAHAYSHTHFPPGWVTVACMFTSLPAFLSTTWTPAGPKA